MSYTQFVAKATYRERSSNRQTDGGRKSISDDLTGSVQKCGHQDIRHRVTKYIIYVTLQITFCGHWQRYLFISSISHKLVNCMGRFDEKIVLHQVQHVFELGNFFIGWICLRK